MDARERRALANEAAAEWWVRLQADDMSRREREQFVEWLRESPLHVAGMLEIAQVHDALHRFQGWTQVAAPEGSPGASEDSTVVPFRGDSTPPASGWKRPLKSPWRVTLIAASLLVVAAGIGWMQFRSGWQVIETERGERREVALADGSVLEVGPETRLRVALTEHQRLVRLEHGATLFHVAKNTRRPFFVAANHTLVRAVGTAFGVEDRAQAIVVTVAEGKVAVLRNRDVSLSANEVRLPPEATAPTRTEPQSPGSEPISFILTAGQQLAVPRTGRIGAVRKVDSERELAWAVGRLAFTDEEVGAVVEQFNRYNRLQLVVSDEQLAHRTVSGVFDASDPESFIAFVTSVAPVRVVRRDDKTITLLPVAIESPKNDTSR